MVWQYLATARPGRPPVRRPNQDLFPRDEFLVAEP
jgi:hypothetical protein